MTDALSTNDCASLHMKMAATELAHWGIIPLQFIQDDFLASVRERHRWYTFRRYVSNDIPPGINRSGDSKKERGFLNKRVLSVIHGIREARGLDDYPRVKHLQNNLRDLSAQLSPTTHGRLHCSSQSHTAAKNSSAYCHT